MLGNFAIGDYWKKEGIGWGWELLVDRFGFDPSSLVATIYKDDDEAFDIWTKELALLPPERVYRLGDITKGDETNFWSPGPTGLCGPCSEVFIDRGPQAGVGEHECSPAENCGRWIEIWNCVFQQYDRKADRARGGRAGALGGVGSGVGKPMPQHDPEPPRAPDRIPETLREEEAKFDRTLTTGLEQLNGAIEAAKGAGYTWIDGDTTFRLYDTFGFPLEMTREIAAGAGLTIDEPGFRRLLDAQRSRSRATAKFSQDVMRFGQLYANLREKRGLRSQFTGYGELETDAKILSLVVGGEPLTDATEGTDVEIVLDRTPFYPEGGGQVGDRGTITTDEGRALVADTQTAAPGVIVMSTKVVDGVLRAGARAHAAVDADLRRDTMRNHTATHLLHATLRRLFGEDVHQAGSLVHAPNLRFDFTFGRALTAEELGRVEDEVNRAILANADVHARSMPLQEALASGAMALFGETYGDVVRVVEAGPSRELCGGTHCHCTGDIGLFLITKEESIGAGVRRIEAVTGLGALREVREMRERTNRAAAALRAPPTRLPEAVTQLLEQRDRLEKDLASVQRSGVEAAASSLLAKAEALDGAKIVAADVGDADLTQLRALSDRLRGSLGRGVVVLGGARAGKPALLVTVSRDLVATVDADKVIKTVAHIIEGRGGGRPDGSASGGKVAGRLGW